MVKGNSKCAYGYAAGSVSNLKKWLELENYITSHEAAVCSSSRR